jgi:hypothetical protein
MNKMVCYKKEMRVKFRQIHFSLFLSCYSLEYNENSRNVPRDPNLLAFLFPDNATLDWMLYNTDHCLHTDVCYVK